MRSWSRIVNKNTSLLPEGGRIKKEISARREQKNGAIVRKAGGL